MVYETAISLGVVVSAFILVYIGTKIKNEEHSYFQMLFMSIGLFVLWAHLQILGFIADTNGETEIFNILVSIQTVYLWLTIFIVFIFIILFVISLFNNMKQRNKHEFDD